MRFAVIINPTSAAGKTVKLQSYIIEQLEKDLGKPHSLFITQSPCDSNLLTKTAIRESCDLIIGIGGDGTIQEIVNGFFENGRPINPDCELGVISSGTGHGFAQSLGFPKSRRR